MKQLFGKSVSGNLKDAAVYALIKNQNGKVKVYKENIYRPMAEAIMKE